MPPFINIAFRNLANMLFGRKGRLHFDEQRKLYFVTDDVEKIYVAHPRRTWRYKRSIAQTVAKLAANYHLENITLNKGDVFIDCGANVGELAIWAKSQGAQYHGFEPDIDAARVCDLNAFEGEEKTNRTCLWHENATLKFYAKTDTADSSVFEIEKYTDFREVPAIPLDEYCSNNGIKNIRLIKVEAEGAEPEVLKGAEKMLQKTEFVTVDCSYERGVKQDHTLVECANLLYAAGFELLEARMKTRCTFLFKKT